MYMYCMNINKNISPGNKRYPLKKVDIKGIVPSKVFLLVALRYQIKKKIH